MTALAIRSARQEDADQLARLFDQLGHPQSGDALRRRLENVLADPRADVLVADDDGGALVGAATYYFVPVAHDGRPWCRITTLVVDEAHRGHGIGQMLVEAETAAREAACSRIEATSALHRAGALRFYERLGYERTSAHFLKRL